MNKFQYMICITLRAPLISFNTSLIHASYKIFNVKSKDVVHKCKAEFGVFPAVADVIDIKKENFIVKYDLSDNLPCQLRKNCNDIVCYTVSVFLV